MPEVWRSMERGRSYTGSWVILSKLSRLRESRCLLGIPKSPKPSLSSASIPAARCRLKCVHQGLAQAPSFMTVLGAAFANAGACLCMCLLI